MQYPSQLLTVNLPNAQGKLTKYYTYDGYLEENVRQSIRDKAHALEHLKWTGTSLFAYIGFIVSRRLPLPPLSIRGHQVPLRGLLFSAIAGQLGYWLFDFNQSAQLASFTKEKVLAAHSLPLWSNLRCGVNPDRAFFELANERHNEPLIFHSGLTPEAARRLIPDLVIGHAPSHKPTLSAGDHHHH